MLTQFSGKTAVITGGATGIGRALALGLVRKGMNVVLASTSAERLERAAAAVREEGGRVLTVQCDVSDREQVERVARSAIERFGRIDTWVNNAGIAMYGRLDDSNETDSRRLFDINFWGVFNGAMAALPHLRANPNGGALINIGSEVSEAAMPVLGMYTASKHAVKGLNDALRIELEHGRRGHAAGRLQRIRSPDAPAHAHRRRRPRVDRLHRPGAMDDPHVVVPVDRQPGHLPDDPVVGERLRPEGIVVERRGRRC